MFSRQRAAVSVDLWPSATRLPLRAPENSKGTGEPRQRGTAHEVGTPTSIVGALAFERGIKRYQLFIKSPPFYCWFRGKRKAFYVIYYGVGGGGKKRLTAMLSQSVDGGRSVRTPHYGSRLWILCLAQCLCLWVDVQPCSGQLGSYERGQERSARQGGGCERSICGRVHFSPLTGEIGGRTGQRWDSSRVTDAEGVRFGPDPERGVVLCELGQEDQVVEGKARLMRPRSESKDRLGTGATEASWRRLFALSPLRRGLSAWERTPDAGRGGSGSKRAGVAVIFMGDPRRLDPVGGQDAKGDCITGQGRSGEKQALPSGSESLISAARWQRKIRRWFHFT